MNGRIFDEARHRAQSICPLPADGDSFRPIVGSRQETALRNAVTISRAIIASHMQREGCADSRGVNRVVNEAVKGLVNDDRTPCRKCENGKAVGDAVRHNKS